MTAISATAAASGLLAFRIQCSDSKPRRGFGNKTDKVLQLTKLALALIIIIIIIIVNII